MTIDDLIAEAAALPLRDAAYAIWRHKSTFERLEMRHWEPPDMSTPEAREKARREFSALIKHEHDTAQDGPSFDRLKRAHPEASDADAKRAIVAAVKFDDDCFRYYRSFYGYLENVERSVALAARDNPGYLATTLRDAENHVAYYMK